MQDIAGARVVMPNPEPPVTPLAGLELVHAVVIAALPAGSEIVNVKDQRLEPDQWGYRSIHVVGRIGSWFFGGQWGRGHLLYEVQLRTEAQDRWAQVVEGLDSRFGWDLKHGNGPADWLEWLHLLSDALLAADLGEPYAIPEMPL